MSATPNLNRRAFLRRGGLAAGAVGAATLVAAAPAHAVTYSQYAPWPGGPIRIHDSRNSQFGPHTAGFRRKISGSLLNGQMAVCINITVTQTVGNGWLAVYPGNASFNGTSNINWFMNGMTIANNAFVGLDPADNGFWVHTLSGSAHVIIDLMASTSNQTALTTLGDSAGGVRGSLVEGAPERI
jgi:hypothetical protein